MPDPRLLLAPSEGVDLGVPLTETIPVVGRAAVELFKLSDVAYGEDAFARDLAALAGDRFHDLRPRPVWPVGAIALRRFPAEAERGRLRRWQDRRNAMLFVGWCVFVLVPPLLLTGLAAHYSELLRIAALAASALASAPLL